MTLPTGEPRAGKLTPRAVALLIDLVVIGTITTLLAKLTGTDAHGWIASVVSWLYFASQESSGWMATLGKRAMGLSVEGSDGRQLTFLWASMRWVARLLSGLMFGLGYVMAAFNDRRQTLHDLLCNTVVVQR